jgi:hypothetical protein
MCGWRPARKLARLAGLPIRSAARGILQLHLLVVLDHVVTIVHDISISDHAKKRTKRMENYSSSDAPPRRILPFTPWHCYMQQRMQLRRHSLRNPQYRDVYGVAEVYNRDQSRANSRARLLCAIYSAAAVGKSSYDSKERELCAHLGGELCALHRAFCTFGNVLEVDDALCKLRLANNSDERNI